MIINKFQGKTEEEAREKAKAGLGANCVIMNVKEIKPKGLFKGLKSSTFEVTAALEEKEDYNVGSITKPTPISEKMTDSINLAADEDIVIPPIEREFEVHGKSGYTKSESRRPEKKKQEIVSDTYSDLRDDEDENVSIEKRLEALSGMLDEKQTSPLSKEEAGVIRLIYKTMLDNDVHEKYVNQIIDEVERTTKPGNHVDMILSNVYQKLVLRFGRPAPIVPIEGCPKVVFFIGPTGVGKTTTIAKIASKFKLEEHKNIAFITADTYRIAATEQLNVYAEILGEPLSVVYSSDELNEAVDKYRNKDLIFVDTAGFSHKNEEQRADVKRLIESVPEDVQKDVYLVLSTTTKYSDLLQIADVYKDIADYKLIFTKLDETDTLGCLLNVRLHTNAELSYITTGQNVPNDIEVLDTQKIVKQLLGGN